MYAGLGIVNPGPSGMTFTSVPMCLTADERSQARSNCRVQVLRGLGQVIDQSLPMTGRLAPFRACDLKDLPVCDLPNCVDERTALYISACSLGQPVPPDVKQFCDSGLAFLYLNAPYCSRPSFLAPPPHCLGPEEAAGRAYCQTHGWQGPNNLYNNLCWLGMKDPGWWAEVSGTPECVEISEPPPPPPPPPPPDETPPLTMTSLPVMPPPPPPPEKRSAATFGVFGILGVIAVGGTGYYLWRKRKK
jgi:hypothetical protein